jgi:hypothetical protein
MDALFDRSPEDWLAHYKAALQGQLAPRCAARRHGA